MRDTNEEAATEARKDAGIKQARSSLLPVRAQDLSLAMEGRALVEAVNFELSGPGTTVVMGPNGAGKSLLLRLLHGLIAPTRGTVSYGDTLLSDKIRRRQAMVFQHPVLLRRSVAANIDFVLKLNSGSHRRVPLKERREELLAQAGLADLAHQAARRLSGGEQQRLALARALATCPQVLFLDEPTASLDPASIRAIEEIISAVRASGAKLVFVTHDIGQARRLADDILFLDRGQLAEHSHAEDFFRAPTSAAGSAYLDGRLFP